MKQRTRVARASDKGTRDLLREALQRGWSTTGGGMRHFRLSCPNPCRCVRVVCSSGSDSTTLMRDRTYLNRHTCWKDNNPT